MKPDAASPSTGKKKARWVICGNFETEKPDQENYSGGADATSLRVMVKKAAIENWDGLTMDVKTAFLNAELNEEEEEDYVIIKPPQMMINQGYFGPKEVFLAKKAVYGLRRSPRLWGKTRDKGLRELEIVTEDGMELRLEPLLSEPNVWKVVRTEQLADPSFEELMALLMTYVDDIFMVGRKELIQLVAKKIQGLWATTTPEYVGEDPVKFLGMDIMRRIEKGKPVWVITQRSSYVKDMLKKETALKSRRIPITRDQAVEVDEDAEDGQRSIQNIREAQKNVGEILWTVTRTRPDLMFSASKMGGGVLKNPLKVIEIAAQVKGYLLQTCEEGITFDGDWEDHPGLEVYTDASYGDRAHGCVMVFIYGSLVLWRSGRQPTASMSTAEAELLEVVEGLVAGESTFAIAHEVFGGLRRTLWTDSQAALAIMSNEGGTWRTRHLRLKSAHARMRIVTGEWNIRHVAGEYMISDMGTKPLASTRLHFLKKEMRMAVRDLDDDLRPEEDEKAGAVVGGIERVHDAAKALKLLAMAAILQTRACEKGVDDLEEMTYVRDALRAGLTLLAILGGTIGLWMGLRSLRRRWAGSGEHTAWETAQGLGWIRTLKSCTLRASPLMRMSRYLKRPSGMRRMTRLRKQSRWKSFSTLTRWR